MPKVEGSARDRFSETQDAPEWQRYTVKGEEFSVLLPEMPAMTTATRVTIGLDPNRQERILGAYADGVVYAIYAFGNRNVKESLDSFVTEVAGSYLPSGTMHFRRDLTVSGFRGRQYSFNSGDIPGVIQFYRTARHLYVFEVIGASESDRMVEKFFSSLVLDESLPGEEVKDGPGAAPSAKSASASAQPATKTNATEDSIKSFSGKDVTRKAVVVTKPEPSYTGLAEKNHVSGTVVLKVVLSSSGRVTNIRAVGRLPDGLTENAIEAARQIRFVPAVKDGRFVSMRMELQYNFFYP
jgi:TonB family protein